MKATTSSTTRPWDRVDLDGRKFGIGTEQYLVAGSGLDGAVAPYHDPQVVEVLGQGCQLGLGEAVLPAIDDVHEVEAVRSQHPVQLGDELGGRQVPQHRQPAEHVAHYQVVGVRFEVRDGQAGIAGDHPK